MRGSSPEFEHKTKEKIMYNKLNEQMELGFDSNTAARLVEARRCRSPQTGWWFDQIRKIIDTDEVAPVMRPVQARFQFPPHRKVCYRA